MPDPGYTVGTWVVDGVEVARGIGEYTVLMDSDHQVVVSFWKGGQPPAEVGVPVLLRSLGPVAVTTNVGGRVEGTPCLGQHIYVEYCGPSWERGKIPSYPMRFQAIDSAGRGVPNLSVRLWTDEPPDPSKYRGTLLLDGEVHTVENPLRKATGRDGVVEVALSYLYGLKDDFDALCTDTKLMFQRMLCLVPIWADFPAKNCLDVPAGWSVLSTYGGGETPPQANRVYAQVEGTALYALEYALCKFCTRWL
jgi:hypothetical protein